VLTGLLEVGHAEPVALSARLVTVGGILDS